jgi:hypothetical protein
MVFLPYSLLFCVADPPRCCRFSSEYQRTLRYLSRATLDMSECPLRSMRPADARIFLYVCPTRGEHFVGNMRTSRWRECAPPQPKPETWHAGTLTLLRCGRMLKPGLNFTFHGVPDNAVNSIQSVYVSFHLCTKYIK